MSPLLAFDLMGTLLSDPYWEALEAATKRASADLETLGFREPYHQLECGNLTEAAYWEFFRCQGVNVDVQQFHRVRASGYSWLGGMRELLSNHSATFRTVIASNYPNWIEEIRAEMFTELDVGWYASCQHGERKPAPAFFEGLCAEYGVGIRDLILIDDKKPNVDSVCAMGGKGIVFISAEDTAVQLAKIVKELDS